MSSTDSTRSLRSVPNINTGEADLIAPTGGARLDRERIAIFLPNLAGGGIARAFLDVADGLVERGYEVDLVLSRAGGPYLDKVGAKINLVHLTPEPVYRARAHAWKISPEARRELMRPVMLSFRSPPALPFIASFARYLDRAQPACVMSSKTHNNLVAVWGRRMARTKPRLLLSEQTHLSAEIRTATLARWRHVAPLVGRVFPSADVITCVSDGVGDDLALITGIPRGRIHTVYNPVMKPSLVEQSEQPVEHPWFDDSGIPVILAVGRLVEQKDFSMLLEAFAELRRHREARLVILGEGRDRGRLEERIRSLGLESHCDMPGFVENPYAYMARASLFAFSSAWEGFGNALVEAMACGCPVVSTDCPSGPSEILAGGRFAPLVPVGDHRAMADAMARTLESPPDVKLLRLRAAAFSLDATVERYLELLFPHGSAERGETSIRS